MGRTNNIFLQVGRQHLKIGRLREAEAAFKRALQDDPDNVAAHENLYDVYLLHYDYDRALQHLCRAYAQGSEDPKMHSRFAPLFRDLGEFDKAEICYRRTMALRPEIAAKCYALIAQITRFKTENEDIRAMEHLFDRQDANSEERRSLGFALGKAYDDIGEYKKAFGFFSEGNRIAKRNHRPTANMFDYRNIIESFDERFVQQFSGIGDMDPTPIFVAGLPRSGTTLVEQILSSHSAVHGAGENGILHTIVKQAAGELGGTFPHAFRNTDSDTLRKISAGYLGSLKELTTGKAHVLDKTMGLHIYIGLIGVILPGAKIIYCRRDLRDQGLSCYQHYFGDQQAFSYDLKNIARYFQGCEQLIDHWTNLFAERIYFVQYENLVTEPEEQTRELLGHCGLGLEPACLTFHDTRRVVQTSSLEQVRNPIYLSSVGRWKNYEQELRPMIDELGYAPSGNGAAGDG